MIAVLRYVFLAALLVISSSALANIDVNRLLAQVAVERGLIDPQDVNSIFNVRKGSYLRAQILGYSSISPSGTLPLPPSAVTSATVFNFKPPQVSFSCTGVSFFKGGLTTIDMDQILDMFDNFKVAKGYAAQMAIKVLCPICESVNAAMQKLSNMAHMNSLDYCGMQKRAFASLGDRLSSSLWSESGALTQATNSRVAQGAQALWDKSASKVRDLMDGFTARCVNDVLADEGIEPEVALNDNPECMYSGYVAVQSMARVFQGSGDQKLARGLSKLLESTAPGNHTWSSLVTAGYVKPKAFELTTNFECSGISQLSNDSPPIALALVLQSMYGIKGMYVTGSNGLPSANLSNPCVPGATQKKTASTAVEGQMEPVAYPAILPPELFTAMLYCGSEPSMYFGGGKFAGDKGYSPLSVCGEFLRKEFSGILGKFTSDYTINGVTYSLIDGDRVQVYDCPTVNGVKDYMFCMIDGNAARVPLSNYLTTDAAQKNIVLAFLKYGAMNYVADALQEGIDAVKNGDPIPVSTLVVLDSSPVPLYRLINYARIPEVRGLVEGSIKDISMLVSGLLVDQALKELYGFPAKYGISGIDVDDQFFKVVLDINSRIQNSFVSSFKDLEATRHRAGLVMDYIKFLDIAASKASIFRFGINGSRFSNYMATSISR